MATRSRAERLGRVRGTRKRVYVAAGIAFAVIAVAAIGAGLALSGPRATAEPAATELDSATLAMLAQDTTTAPSAETTGVLVEVPHVVGTPLEEAELLLGVAGLEVVRVSTPPGEAATGTVLAQSPTAGERVTPGSAIELVWADPAATSAPGIAVAGAPASGTGPERPPGRTLVVCIDPGHQASANTAPEPVGPGSSETKPKVTGGGVGVVTKQTEYALTLTLSLKVKQRLEARGVRVVMTRTANEVDISNAQRAQVANDAGADLFLRIHADSSTNADLRGISTLYPGGNAWVAPIESRSFAAAKAVHQSVIAATKATDRGLVKRADLAGFNWSAVPSVLVETGFLSNPVDDRQLADPAYQDTLADAVARGVLSYLGM